jgi:hypothetical protein
LRDSLGSHALSTNLANQGSVDRVVLGGYLGTETLVNKDNTIQGQGFIEHLASFQNQGTVDANIPGTTLYILGAPTTNTGTLRADAGAVLNLNYTTLTNFDSTTGTLIDGTYEVRSGTLSFNNNGFSADIVTNAAKILLDGTSGPPSILDQNGNNALANLARNAGQFILQNGVNLTSAPSDFTNSGRMTVGDRSTFTVGGLNTYINTGLLQGTGTVEAGLVSSSGTVHPGNGPGILTINGSYSQTSSGILDIELAGSSSYSALAVAGSASLDGMLNLSLTGGFMPFDGEQFVILTSRGLSGTFLDSTIKIDDVTFTVEYSPSGFTNDVVLDAHVSSTSVPEPSELVMFVLGLAGMGALFSRRSRRRGRAE